MKLKLNQKIKTHIVQMAIRQKFQDEYDAKFLALSEKLGDMARVENKSHLFDNLDSYVLSCVKSTTRINLDYRFKFLSADMRVGLSIRNEHLTDIYTDKLIYGDDHYFRFKNGKDKDLVKEFHLYVKEIEKFAEAIESAICCFKSANKMFKELPWTEDLYPESEKAPNCNIIPVSAIALANDLMGVKVQKQK